MESECVSIFRKALQESARDYRDILSLDMPSRKRLYRELESLYSSISGNCSEKLGMEMAKSGMANTRLAQLKVCMAIGDELKQKGIEDQEANTYVTKFSEDEYEAVSKLEHFSRIDSLNSDSIRTLLMNRDDQIYRLIKEWYNENMDNFLNSIDILSGKDVRGEISNAMEERYRIRFQKITEGVISFIQSDPGQLKKLFNNYERVLKMSLDLENRRTKIEEELRELISGSRMDEVMDRVMEVSVLLRNRDLEMLQQMNLSETISQLKQFETVFRNKIREIEDEKARLDSDPDISSNPELKTVEAKRIELLIQESKAKLESDVVSKISLLNAVKSAVVNASKKGTMEFSKEYACSIEDTKIRQVAFFESLEYLFKNETSIRLIDPKSGFEGNLKLKEILSKKREEEVQISPSSQNYPVKTKAFLYWFSKSRFFRPNVRISFAFIFNVHEEELFGSGNNQSMGIDQKPFNNMDFAKILGFLIDSSSNDDSFITCIIGSPNGFDNSVTEQIKNLSNDGIKSRKFVIVLKDMRTGQLYSDPEDRMASEIAKVLREGREGPGIAETEKIKTETLDDLMIANISRLKSVLKRVDTSEDKIVTVWKAMEKEKLGQVDKIQNETVFKKK